METYQKSSVTPLPGLDPQDLGLPFGFDGLRIDSIEGLLQSQQFAVWKHYISDDSIDRLLRAKVGLIHDFESGYTTGKEEEDSKDLLLKAFMCLRVIKPTRTQFSLVHYRRTKTKEIDIISTTWPPIAPMILPESEVLNQINLEDLQQLKSLWPAFRAVRDSGPGHLRRATRYYETGYVDQRDFDLQFITWVMGIEALYADGDEPCDPKVLKQRILQSIGADTDIYAQIEHRSLYAPKPLPVKEVIDNMFELRNRFVHGAWAPRAWLDTPMRKGISDRPLTLVDVLREAAGFILRAGIKKKLMNTTNSV